MNLEQAIMILEQASAQAALTKAAHIQVEQALNLIKEKLKNE
jgi:hypothetical protein